jgi:acyl-CoA thioesterase FadM
MSLLTDLLTRLTALLTMRSALLILLLINFKSLPFSWHIRLFWTLYRHWNARTEVVSTITHARQTHAKTHPLFDPVSITLHSPLYETDYNLHKSNATYFSDLDHARTALVGKLVMPAWGSEETAADKNLVRMGRPNVILGAVHATFHKEIKAYERYECRSRLLGWDRKWLVIGTWLVRPSKTSREKAVGKEVLLASCLSKYVVKRGRVTVEPARVLRLAGWLPEAPSDAAGAAESSERAAASSSRGAAGTDTTRWREQGGQDSYG